MRKLNYLVSAILTAVLCFSGNLLAYSGDGDGSTENPYQISTVEDWQELMAAPDDWSSSFILTADVNLAGVTLTPVGNESTPFTGVFDGNDNIISNAVINQPGSDFVGLFSFVGSGGQIRNLGVEDVNMTGSYFVGGLVGWNSGPLTSCYATGSVSGYGDVGGLVGFNVSGTLTDCFATGSVTGSGDGIGGLVGSNGDWMNSGGNIISCYATGLVSGSGDVGGLVGFNVSGTLTDCFATGSVTGGSYVGGLVGCNELWFTYINITYCYATGSVTGHAWVGGMVGWNGGGSLTDCFATGSVSGNYFIGGLVGMNDGTITSCFWDIQTSGLTYSDGGTGKTTAEMKTLSTFTSAGWNFVEIWGIGENQTYPYLRTESPGDLDHDKKVDFADFAILASHWLEGL